MDRPYDVAVWGATGTVGKLIAENLATHYTVGSLKTFQIPSTLHECLSEA